MPDRPQPSHEPSLPAGAAPHPAGSARHLLPRGEKERQRRDIVSGAVMDEAQLIRFVAAPNGAVVPDLARKLPGRGLWVAATREAVETAARKNLFARAAKARLAAPSDLADQVERRLTERLLAGLGLARKAGDLTFGFERVLAATLSGKAAWLVEASDGAEDGRRKLLAAARKATPPPRLMMAFTSGELGLALGAPNVIHTAYLAGRGAERWTLDVERLSGFRPLLPEGRREEPRS